MIRIGMSLLLVLGLSLGLDAQQKKDSKQIEFFEKKIRPLFAKHCYKCHGPKKQESELRLDTVEGLEQGGSSGPLFEPGKPSESLLISVVKYEEEDLQMPPEEMLSEKEIGLLVEWIKRGAHFPAASAPKAAPKKRAPFWSFQPARAVALPAVKQTSWPRNGLDRFILAGLESKGLSPAPEADKRTLIRRATFDLTGLPPSPSEVATFLADKSPHAYRRVIDRLLASPAYGERWGRFWLDVVRYADSNGLDENIAHGNAWRYRDYVISSFNGDESFSRFILKQIAGDLLPAKDRRARHEQLIATGFLSLGPKVLAEVDERKMEMDIVDEQVDTVGRAFMAVTLGCARCHDHKFDPLTTADYYALAGIFKSTRTMEHFTKIARWNENAIPSPQDERRKAEHERQLKEIQDKIAAVVKSAKQAAAAKSNDGKTAAKSEAAFDAESKKQLAALRAQLKKKKAAAPEVPTAMGVTDGKVADTRVHRRGSHLTLGPVVPRGFPKALAPDGKSLPADASGRLQLGRWLSGPRHPLTTRVMVNRLWRWHFGRGLVASTDNFGELGDRPTHPLLLDWLAVRFGNGSIKGMHRLMMLSATYRMSGRSNPAGSKVDADNLLLWRFPLRRLEAESIRDSLLAVGGLLDRSMGGSMLHVKNRAFLFDHTSKDETKYESDRRSVYLPVIRNHLYDLFSLFDYSDASVVNGNRDSTTVAPQALFMMNSKFVDRVAKALAESILANGRDNKDRFERLYLRCYGRPPSGRELQRGTAFLARFAKLRAGNELDAWAAFSQALLSANEFVYVR